MILAGEGNMAVENVMKRVVYEGVSRVREATNKVEAPGTSKNVKLLWLVGEL
jgi:hypothetical protein